MSLRGLELRWYNGNCRPDSVTLLCMVRYRFVDFVHRQRLALVLSVPTPHKGEARLSAAPQGSRRVAFGRIFLPIYTKNGLSNLLFFNGAAPSAIRI